jgi:hypothetical protein
MNTYLSKKEKELFTRLDALLAVSEDVIKLYEKVPSTDKEFMRFLRSGKTWLDKALAARFGALDPDSKRDLQKNAAHMQVLLVPNDRVKEKFRELEKLQSVLHMPYDDFEDWYGAVIQLSCGVCKSKGQEFRNCKIRRILMKYGIHPVNTRATEDICQYSYPDAGIHLRDLTKKAEKDGLTPKEIAGLIMEKSPEA